VLREEIVIPHCQEDLDAGLAVLRFDYRCLGESEGEPRQHIDPWAQIEDYKNAISFVMTKPEADPNRVGSGASRLGARADRGATDPRVRCIVSNIPVVMASPTCGRTATPV
jgi:hypothetical protein